MNSDGTSRCFIAPIRAVSSANNLEYNSTTFEVTYDSSRREVKKNIEDLDYLESNKIYNLQSRSFIFKENNVYDIGFIAEEVAEVHPHFAKYENDKPQNINWKALTSCLVQEIQTLKRKVEDNERRIIELSE